MRDKIMKAIDKAIDDVNEKAPVENQISKSPEVVFLGFGSSLDSLGFVSLMVAVGIRIEQETGHHVNLFDTNIMSLENNPLRNLASLADFIEEKLKAGGI